MVPNTASTRFRAGPGLWPRSARFANFNRTGFNCFWGRRISDIARCLSPPISRCFDRLLCRRGFRIFRARIRWRGCMGLAVLVASPRAIAGGHKVARALKPGGKFLFTSPKERTTWRDALTGRESISLGAERYQQLLDSAGLNAVGELYDEGNNHYYLVAKPPGTGPS